MSIYDKNIEAIDPCYWYTAAITMQKNEIP